MSGAPETLKVFSAVIKVVLSDGVLTQEEKRLIIAIGRELELDDGDPLNVYNAVIKGEEIGESERSELWERSERLQTTLHMTQTTNYV